MEQKDQIKSLESPEKSPENPFSLFGFWFDDALKAEPVDPNAMSLATVDSQSRPSVRMVLLKSWDQRGFVFYTNMQSRKGLEISANPHAAVCFHWKSLARAIRIEGKIIPVTSQEADEYYNSRGRGSRIGAWASQQSRPLENRSTLVGAVSALEKKYEGRDDIPRPAHWTGNRIIPNYFEFWHDGEHRLHTRLTYTRGDSGLWTRGMLYP